MQAPELDPARYDDTQRRAFGEICEVLVRMEGLLEQGAPASVIGPALYHPDLLCVGEGNAQGSRGLDAFLPSLHELLGHVWAPNPKAEYVIRDPVIVCADSAAMLIEFRISPDHGRRERQVYRAMYGWCRTPQGWRIQLEMYGQGPV